MADIPDTSSPSQTPATQAAASPSAPATPAAPSSTTGTAGASTPSGQPSQAAPGSDTAGAVGPAVDDAYLDAMSGLVGDILGRAFPQQPQPPQHPHQPQAPAQQQVNAPQVQTPQAQPQTPAQPGTSIIPAEALAAIKEMYPELPDQLVKPLEAAFSQQQQQSRQALESLRQEMAPLRQFVEQMAEAHHARQVESIHKVFDGMSQWKAVYGADGAKLSPDSPQAKAREAVFALAGTIAERTGRSVEAAIPDAHAIIHRETVNKVNERSRSRTPAGAGTSQGGAPAKPMTREEWERQTAARYNEQFGTGAA